MSQTFYPFDSGAGSAITEAQWRAMAKLWLSDGVVRGDLSSLAVVQRGAGANKSVDVGSGRAWVDGHFYQSDATENLIIADNASGNPRIDRIVLRADFTANTIALAVVQGTPAATPAAPALTQTSSVWEIPLAQVAVANGFTQILAANITDERQYAAGKADWQHIPAALTYASADGHTFVATTGGVDLTGIVPVGARVKLTQVAGVFYGIVTAVSATQLTMYGGTDWTLGNAAISSPEFSIAKVPRGFNPNPAKWTETLKDTSDRTQATAVQNTWYNPGSLSLSVPIGAWRLGFKGTVQQGATSVVQATLSTTNNGETDTDYTVGAYTTAGVSLYAPAAVEKPIIVAAKTPYYLNIRTTGAGTPTIGFMGATCGPSIIRAICAYL